MAANLTLNTYIGGESALDGHPLKPNLYDRKMDSFPF